MRSIPRLPSDLMLIKSKKKNIAIALAFSCLVSHVSGLHKFYLGQRVWGVLYVLLSNTPIPLIASLVEVLWYLLQDSEEFDARFNLGSLPLSNPSQTPPIDPQQVGAIAEALRHLDQLREDGLISEYEFEQKRRQLLDRIA